MNIRIAFPLVLIFVVSAESFAQSKWDKSIAKAEASYAIGAYGKAKSALAKFKKKANSKLGSKNQFTPTIYFLQAKYDLASGMPLDFENNLREALNACRTLHTEHSEKYGTMLMDAAELYNLNGSYRLAKEYLNNSKKILQGGDFMKEPMMARWDVLMAETLTGQGYWNESIALARTRQIPLPASQNDGGVSE